MARFGAESCRSQGSDNQTPSPVIPHVVDKYDPDHPDADWGGYNLTYDEEGGIIPREPADNSTITGRKMFEPQQNSSTDQVPGIPFQSAVYQVMQVVAAGRYQGVGLIHADLCWRVSANLLQQRILAGSPREFSGMGTRSPSRADSEHLMICRPPERHLTESFANPTSKTLLAEN
ncbi:unnamed protein product [Phytophthora fragariaefolia]|uniref:Unnamed protein product n=1 Tax=Phytophthora fragariaefolia TaxID=1490495 RepID=A0A9W7CR87_9STRA|nr:unnamed protein product [Phytophthora fragariaefolia]